MLTLTDLQSHEMPLRPRRTDPTKCSARNLAQFVRTRGLKCPLNLWTSSFQKVRPTRCPRDVPYGRGFSVVAEEVGNLAQTSGKAATEISTSIEVSKWSTKAMTALAQNLGEGRENLVQTLATLQILAFGKEQATETFSDPTALGSRVVEVAS